MKLVKKSNKSDIVPPLMFIGAIAAGMALMIITLQTLMLSYDFFVQGQNSISFKNDFARPEIPDLDYQWNISSIDK